MADEKGITIQVIGGIRSFTIPKEDVIKIHRGCATINHPRLGKNIVITPKSIVTLKEDRAKWMLKYVGVQKYGVDKL